MPDFSDLGLPEEVTSLIELTPAEDVVLHVLRERLPSVPSYSLIPEHPPPLFILVRRDHAFGQWTGDTRFTDAARIRVDVFAVDPDGDEKGALVSEAVRVVCREATKANHHVPGRGWVTSLSMAAEPSRKTDWATASGPVQYADLPTGYWRYESKYDLRFRRQIP